MLTRGQIVMAQLVLEVLEQMSSSSVQSHCMTTKRQIQGAGPQLDLPPMVAPKHVSKFMSIFTPQFNVCDFDQEPLAICLHY